MSDTDEVTIIEAPPAAPLQLDEIKRRYPDQFVAMSNVIWEDCKVRGGIPRAYSRNPRALTPFLKTLHGLCGVTFTGQRRNPRDWVATDVGGGL